MITDPAVLADIRQQWSVIDRFASPERRCYVSSAGIIINFPKPPPEFLNLPFVLAYSLLDQTLGELFSNAGIPLRPRVQLGEKMEQAVAFLEWDDYATIDAGKNMRNDLAHRGDLQGPDECLRYIRAIEQQLKTWNIL